MNRRTIHAHAVPALVALTLATGIATPAAHATTGSAGSAEATHSHEESAGPGTDEFTTDSSLSSLSAAAAASYGTPRNNPHPAANSRAPRPTPRTQFVDDEIARLTGERDCAVGGYRTYQRPTSNHNTGNALDCLISSRYGIKPTAAQREQGWKLARWLRTHANRLDVRYVIWDKKIWSVARSREGWRTYTAGTGVTGGHLDHVHISIQNPGNRD